MPRRHPVTRVTVDVRYKQALSPQVHQRLQPEIAAVNRAISDLFVHADQVQAEIDAEGVEDERTNPTLTAIVNGLPHSA
jgi:hypothetical protein